MNSQKLYTVGYTLFKDRNGVNLDSLFATLKKFNISHIVDVRSIPFSKQYPQCCSASLKLAGERYGIYYIHIPELGAKANPQQNVFSRASEIFLEDIFPISPSKRPEKVELTKSEEVVDFKKFLVDEFFNGGISRINQAYEKKYTLALMCSEKEPINCHRYFLISRKIEEIGKIAVEHIIRNTDGEIDTITNSELDKNLKDIVLKKEEIKKLNFLMGDCFNGQVSIIDKYEGDNIEEKEFDFCNRYWNLIHGWKKYNE